MVADNQIYDEGYNLTRLRKRFKSQVDVVVEKLHGPIRSSELVRKSHFQYSYIANFDGSNIDVPVYYREDEGWIWTLYSFKVILKI